MTKLRRCSPEIERELHDKEARIRELEGAMDEAWGVIANASDWIPKEPGTPCERSRADWQEAAERWRDERFHPLLRATSPPDSEPLNGCRICGGSPRINGPMPDDGYGNEGGYCIECVSCGASTSVKWPVKDDPIPLLREEWNAGEVERPPDSEPAEGEGGQCPRCGVGGLVTIEGRDWISVHDALPHKGSLVLVTYKGGKRGRSVHVARWTGGKWLLTDRMKKVQDRVTAWMPCPNPFVGPGKSFRTSNEPAEGEGDDDDLHEDPHHEKGDPTVRKSFHGGYVWTYCDECGPDVKVDEDGLCIACGKDAVYFGKEPDDTAEQQDAMLERREAALPWEAITRYIDLEVANYTFEADEGVHEPTDFERLLIMDFAHGIVPGVLRRALSRTSDEGTGCVVPDAMLERREALERLIEEIRVNGLSDDTEDQLRQALSRTSDEGTGCVVPEAVSRYLDSIIDLERVTRQGGAEPEDLSDLEWAVQTAVQHAGDAKDALDRAIAEQGGQTAGWIHIDQQLPQPFVHVALCTDDRYENAPGVEENRVKAVGYLNNSFGGYWSIKGERATSLRAFPWWAPLPAAPQPEHGESDE